MTTASHQATTRRIAQRALPAVLALVACTAASPAQDTPEVGGTVVDQDDNAVAGARVDFRALDVRALPRRGLKGVYTLAQARHRAQIKLPRTVTDREGRWRVLLSPQQAALALAGAVELEMRVEAPGFATWQRAIGPDLLAANAHPVHLQPLGAGLTLNLSAAAEPARGFVLVERAFRVRGSQSIWLRDLLPITDRGTVRFAEPPGVPGELAPTRPTARAEGYRISVFAAGMARVTTLLAEGEHHLALQPSDYGSRRILAERAEPARPPIELTYAIADQERTLTSEQAIAPVLGDQVPIRIQTGSGPVEIDSWDPDLPMFVVLGEAAAAAGAPRDVAPPRRDGVLRLDVVDRRAQPLFGAGVWIENQCVAEAATDAAVFGLSDARGRVELHGLPSGSYRVLVRHPQAGELETLATVRDAVVSQQVRLRPHSETEPEQLPLEGTLLLDVTALFGDESLEIGMVTADRRVVRRRFDEVPRLVRLAGLVPGPTTFYLRRGDAPPLFFGGVLAGATPEPAMAINAPEARHFTLTVLDDQGQPVADTYLSLGEGALRDQRAFSASLFSLGPGSHPGQHVVDLAVHGSLWLRVHGPQGAARDLELGPTSDAALEVTLRPAPPDPNAKIETTTTPKEGPDKPPDKPPAEDPDKFDSTRRPPPCNR